MSLLDENINIPFSELLKSSGWTLRSVKIERPHLQIFENSDHFAYDGIDCNNHRYIIRYYPIGSYVYGIKLRKSVVIVQASIYERNSDAEIVRCWNTYSELWYDEDELMDLWVHIKNGIFDTKFYKKFTPHEHESIR